MPKYIVIVFMYNNVRIDLYYEILFTVHKQLGGHMCFIVRDRCRRSLRKPQSYLAYRHLWQTLIINIITSLVRYFVTLS